MARHIELEPPSVNNLNQIMNSRLASDDKEKRHKFYNMVFQKLTEKIGDGVNGPKHDGDLAALSNSTTDENTSEDDNIDCSIKHLDSFENISVY